MSDQGPGTVTAIEIASLAFRRLASEGSAVLQLMYSDHLL